MLNAVSNLVENVVGHKPTATTTGKPESDVETMDALVWHGKENVHYERVAKPIIADTKDALIRVTASTICGSDLHVYTNEVHNLRVGQVLGHEAMGIVEQIGPDVKDIRVGDRVVIAFDIACGDCPHCRRKEFTGCQRTNPSKLMEGQYGHTFGGIFGFGGLAGHYSGCQAEYVRVPFADVNCLPVPVNVPDEKALYLSDIACTSYHAAIDLGQVHEGDKVAIWGAGPIGILTAKWCELYGASEIYVIENVPERIALIREKVFRAYVINFDEVDVVEELAKFCPDGVDVSIECAGFRYAKSALHRVERALMMETDTSDLVNECIKATRLWGRMVLISDYLGFTNHFNIGGLMEKHIFLSGGQCPCQAVWPKVLPHIQDGSFDPTICVTYFGKLSDGPELYKKFHLKQDGIVKVFLRPNLM